MSENKQTFSVYEVFSQKSPTASFTHQFSLLAPNHEVAMTMARENFMRREPAVNIWVVKRDDIYVLPPEERPHLERMDNKAYRETKGYGDLQAKWRYHKEQYERKNAAK
ncbi:MULTISPECIES: 1,2-phenylacetyl-CoA epoxidase subunit PaaB [Aneurinibacillus]|uniref:1,2-phenylacetyl-CoA epoxidase subunit B n=1 Tax=Aneurinibacillus thermoaerophilus TaxID=143495 RepID=A0A1G8AUT1_ANETH|nr:MULTISPECIES: 1,2-phenylacetyl-CoA epoxidase subunit PaaB [Aneurinibacillus]AMA72825.1 phenylacetate-CoA oxygenase [Aneurinibacillus sp. XH2]MED0675211.1 1,2-phenylacetyl-CoA epoxidase subunit B [Aneurinibacillus thermoaerophilus]MED0680093.1 1,2-phenylacetyl-CoA epoxidase subunit B [Aneurinibacillus thermoaerophilus]MED0738149.1 1,2-phenylacetyl-CoA epoxidase subunit B [Aneurinibacillus thermoaerophilus]MED0758233.1 1,2-phenylacetyl-CoA epoxidase subunit B [Aneurinibacillus thermoaerophilu